VVGPVVPAIPPSTAVEAIAVCVNNEAGAQIDATMRMSKMAMKTDPAQNESFIMHLKYSFHLRDLLKFPIHF
jgi:hypothetical protein